MLEQVNLFEKKIKSDFRCCQKNYERLMIVTAEIYLLLIHCPSGHYNTIHGKANKPVTNYTMTNENKSEDVQNGLN